MSTLPEFINQLKNQLEFEQSLRGRWVDLGVLLQKGGLDFVTACYVGLLDREPDSEGLQNYLGRVERGEDSIGLILEIYASEESAKVGKILYFKTKDQVISPSSPVDAVVGLVNRLSGTESNVPTQSLTSTGHNADVIETGSTQDFLRLAGALIFGRPLPSDLADRYTQKLDLGEVTRLDVIFDMVTQHGYTGQLEFNHLPPSMRPIVQGALGVRGSIQVAALSDRIAGLQRQLEALQSRVVDQEAQLRTFRYAFTLQDRLLDLLAPRAP